MVRDDLQLAQWIHINVPALEHNLVVFRELLNEEGVSGCLVTEELHRSRAGFV